MTGNSEQRPVTVKDGVQPRLRDIRASWCAAFGAAFCLAYGMMVVSIGVSA